MYENGEGTRMNYHKAIHNFSEYLEFGKKPQEHTDNCDAHPADKFECEIKYSAKFDDGFAPSE